MKKGDVVQFNETHKWIGCLGIIDRVKCKEVYLVGVPMPSNDGNTRTAYIFAEESELEHIGKAVMVQADTEGGESE